MEYLIGLVTVFGEIFTKGGFFNRKKGSSQRYGGISCESISFQLQGVDIVGDCGL